MTDDQFRTLCNTYGFAPSRALRELVDTAIAQSRITGSPHCERSCEANAFQIEIRRLKAQLTKDAELRRLHHNNQVLKNALWKACGDDEEAVNATIESQGELK